MLLLTSTSDIIRVVAGTASCIEPHASWVDNDSGTITPGRTNTAILGSGTTTVVAAPSSGQRNVKHLSLRNEHASSSCDVTVEHFDGTNAETMIKVTLLAGETLVFDESGRWWHYDVNGGEYSLGVGMATRGDMESAVRSDVAVSPGVQHYHPGHPKAWVKNGVSGNSLASYNVSSVTDTAAGQCAPQIGTDFATTTWCCLSTIERSSTSLAITDLKHVFVRFALQTASGVTLECYDGSVTSAVVEDPSTWHMLAFGTLV